MPSHSIDTSKLDSLREQYNNDIVSEDSSPFPLWALLTIYDKGNYQCYIDYMAGFKLLVDWLAPIDTEQECEVPNYPDMLVNYEITEIANILKISDNILIYTILANTGIHT